MNNVTLPLIPNVISPPDPTAKPSPRSGSPDTAKSPPLDMGPPPSARPITVSPEIMAKVQDTAKNSINATIERAKQVLDMPAGLPSLPQSSHPSNPVAIPDAPPSPPVPRNVPVEQRMAAARDALNSKLDIAGYKNSATTIRLDVTSDGQGIEFIVYSSRLPDTNPPTRFGTLGKYPTIKAVEDAIESFIP